MTSRLPITLAALTTIVLLTVPSIAFASSKQTITLGVIGAFVGIDTQKYSQSGGKLVSISLPDSSIPTSSGKLTFSLHAQVSGMLVSGDAQFKFATGGSNDDNGKGSGDNKGADDHGDSDKKGTSVKLQATLTGMIPALQFPLGCETAPPCTSAIPAFFTGSGDLKVTTGGKTTDTPIPLILFESAYLNPFGGPIFMGTVDGSISIAARYSSQTNNWTGVQIAGFADSGTGASGSFTLTSNLVEHLVSGTEKDTGQMILSGFLGPFSYLNSAGTFGGKSTVPSISTVDCSSDLSGLLSFLFGSPVTLPSNICHQTGSHSTGSSHLLSNDKVTRIKGIYSLDWLTPAVGFAGTVTAGVGDAGDD